MNELVSIYPGKELHVVLDDFSTHKPKEDRWLKSHLNVHFHFIPTHSSWLNQVECWFSILSRGALEGSSFTSVRMLVQIRLSIRRIAARSMIVSEVCIRYS
jgi:transposase